MAHGSYEALLDDPSIEAVYVPLPNTMHDEWARKAAERGKHILCEKPLTPTAKEAQQLVDFCQLKKVCLMDGFMWPHHPRTIRMRNYLDDGGIGEVQRVTGSFTFPLEPLDPNRPVTIWRVSTQSWMWFGRTSKSALNMNQKPEKMSR